MIKNEKTKQAEYEFFARDFQMSYSGLNKLVYSPALFYRHYILKQRDEEMSPALLNGKVIHCLLLDDGSFNNQFILLPGTMPGDNTKKVIHKVFEKSKEGDVASTDLNPYFDEIVAILAEMKLHQSLTDDKKADKDGVQRTGDQKRVDKIVTPDSQEYFEFLLQKGERDVVDIPTMEYCTEIVELLRQNPDVIEALGLGNEDPNIQTMNEIGIEVDKSVTGLPFGFKGILDSVKINHTNKTICINDLKTTSKSISDFSETVEFWNLWMQAAMYKKLVTQEFLINNNLNPKEWSINFTFVVVDKYQQIYPFKVTDETMINWELQLEVKISEAKWHFENERFDLPYIYATSSVTL